MDGYIVKEARVWYTYSSHIRIRISDPKAPPIPYIKTMQQNFQPPPTFCIN